MEPRILVISDVHGALKALDQLLCKVNLRADDRLIFLGDYVDGWSESALVIDYLIALDKSHDCIFIKGNHDAWCEAWLKGDEPDIVWLANGGRGTIASYMGMSMEQKQLHIDFFAKMEYYWVDTQNRLFIHAGFSSIHGPDKEFYKSNCFWDRTLWEMAIAMDKNIGKDSKLYPKRLLIFNEIYVGHTPTLNYNSYVPMESCNVWNIDTGAAFYGRLSAMNIEDKKVWQSDIVQTLYPNEKGRN